MLAGQLRIRREAILDDGRVDVQQVPRDLAAECLEVDRRQQPLGQHIGPFGRLDPFLPASAQRGPKRVGAEQPFPRLKPATPLFDRGRLVGLGPVHVEAGAVMDNGQVVQCQPVAGIGLDDLLPELDRLQADDSIGLLSAAECFVRTDVRIATAVVLDPVSEFPQRFSVVLVHGGAIVRVPRFFNPNRSRAVCRDRMHAV